MTIARIGVPRGHTLLLDHFANGLGPGNRVVIAQERHGGHLPGPVAFLAILLQDAHDLVAEGDAAVGLRRRGPGDDATRGVRSRLAHRLARQHLVQGLGEVGAGRLDPFVADAELIVDAAAIANLVLAVQDKCLRRALGGKEIGHMVALVLEHGEGKLVLAGMEGDALGRVLLIGVDGQELDAPLCVGLLQLGQARHVDVVDRALGAHEDDHDGLLAVEIRQRNLAPVGVSEGKVRNDLFQVCRRRVGGTQSQRHTAGDQKQAKQKPTSIATLVHELILSLSGCYPFHPGDATVYKPSCGVTINSSSFLSRLIFILTAVPGLTSVVAA